MATNDRNIKLRVSAEANNLSELQKAADALEKLAREQDQFAKSTGTAGTSIDKLKQDLAELNRVGNSLNGIANLNDAFFAQRRALQQARTELIKARANYDAYAKSLEGVKRRTDEQRATLKGLAASVTQAERAQRNAQNSSRKLAQQLIDVGVNSRQAQRGIEGLIAATQKQINLTKQDISSFGDRQLEEQKRLTAEKQRQLDLVRQRINAERQIGSGFRAFSQQATTISRSASVAPAQERERDAALRLLDIERRYQDVLSRKPQLQNASAQAAQRNANATNQLATATKRASESMFSFLDGGRKALSIYQRVRGELLSLAAAYVGVFGVRDFVGSAINAQNDRIALQTRLLVANGNNASAAAADFNQLRAEADRLGLSLNDLGGVYSRLRIAGSAAGFATEEVQTVFRNFAETSRVFNLSADDTAGVFRALEQILSKGKIQAEELRGQLGDRLPGAATVLARALQVSDAELNKLLETGSITSRDLIKFSEEYAKIVAGQLPAATNSFSAQVGRLKTAYDDFLIAVADSGLIEALRELAVELTNFLKSAEGAETARQLGATFREVGAAIKLLIFDTGALKIAFEAVLALVGLLVVQFGANLVAGLASARNGLIAYSVAAGGAATVTGGLTAAVARLNAGFLGLLKNPIFLIGAAIAAPFVLLTNEVLKTAEAMDRGKVASEGAAQAIRELEIARGTNEEVKARERIKGLIGEARSRLAAAEGAIAQAEAQRALNEQLDRSTPLGEPGERAFRASRDLAANTRLEEQKAAAREARKDIEELGRALFDLGEKNAQDLAIQNASTGGAASAGGVPDPKAVEDRLNRIKELREQANEEAVNQLKALLGELEQEEETAVAARIALINIEADARIAALRAAAEEARKLGAEDIAAQNELNIAGVNLERQRQIEAVNRTAAEENAKKAAEATREEYDKQKQSIDNLIRARDLEIERINTQRELGLLTSQQAEQAAEKITLDYQPRILAGLTSLRDFIEANRDALAKMFNVEEVLLELDALQVKTETVVTAGQRRAQELKESFAQGAAQALSSLGTGIADAIRGFSSFGDAIKGARDAFLNFAADFLVQIGQMILQQAILNALQNSNNGFFQTVGNILAGVNHTGGMAGSGPRRSVPASLFANAPRYHSGGVVGLKPDEVPAILQTGEEVLTRSDPRNRMNGGATGGANVQIVNAIDAESVVAAGLQGSAGRQIITNIIQANKSQFRQLLAS